MASPLVPLELKYIKIGLLIFYLFKKKKKKKKKMEKKNEFDVLPRVLIEYISLFLDFNSIIRFSCADKRLKEIMQKRISPIKLLNQLGFQNKEENRKNLLKKDLTTLIDEIKNNPIHSVCYDAKNLKHELVLLGDFSFYKSSCLERIDVEYQIELSHIVFLVENKCDLSLPNKLLNTPLLYASENQNITFEILKYFVDMKTGYYFFFILNLFFIFNFKKFYQ